MRTHSNLSGHPTWTPLSNPTNAGRATSRLLVRKTSTDKPVLPVPESSLGTRQRRFSLVITLEQYFQAKPRSPEHEAAATDLLARVNALIDAAVTAGAFHRVLCPNTGSEISGSKGGSGDGGFRLSTSTTGSARSSHKEARAVDVYDPRNELDGFIDDALLKKHDLYREAPASTPRWCHLTTRAPASKRRTFNP